MEIKKQIDLFLKAIKTQNGILFLLTFIVLVSAVSSLILILISKMIIYLGFGILTIIFLIIICGYVFGLFDLIKRL